MSSCWQDIFLRHTNHLDGRYYREQYKDYDIFSTERLEMEKRKREEKPASPAKIKIEKQTLFTCSICYEKSGRYKFKSCFGGGHTEKICTACEILCVRCPICNLEWK